MTDPSLEPATGGNRGRIAQIVPDIGSNEDLIRYAVAAQLARLAKLGVSANLMARAVKGGSSNLSHGLAGRTPLPNDTLRQLDEVIVAVAPELDHTGGLAQFGVRIRGLSDRASLTARIPPSWTRDLLKAPSADEVHVLLQASALLANCFAASEASRGSRRQLRSHDNERIGQIVDHLILIGGAPPTQRNIEAQILLGGLAKYAFETTSEKLEDALRYTPLGFRAWRALTKLVVLSKDDLRKKDNFLDDNLRPIVRRLLSEAQQLRATSIYPGRSGDLELAIITPREWLDPEMSATDVLRVRALDGEATLRERGTAAMGIWQRALEHGRSNEPEVKARLRELVKQFKQAEKDRPEIASGLRWVTSTLNTVMADGVPICNDWPETEEPWFKAVHDAAESLERENIPQNIRRGTRNLFLHTILQNAGAERRKAIDALVAGGWTEPVARAFGTILRDDRTEGWVRIRALFALGFLQHRGIGVTRSLTFGCEQAYRNLMDHPDPPRAYVTEMHAALFAVGDCFGVEQAERNGRHVRENLRSILNDLVRQDRTNDPTRYPIARALAYMLTFTAQPREGNRKDLSQELLEALRDHPDETTQQFSRWALGFRFGEDGEVRPLLSAAG